MSRMANYRMSCHSYSNVLSEPASRIGMTGTSAYDHLLRSVTSIFFLRTKSARIEGSLRWEKGADPNCLCITWIVTSESLETAPPNKIRRFQRAMLHRCSSAGRLAKEAYNTPITAGFLHRIPLCCISRVSRNTAASLIQTAILGLCTWSRHS